MHANVQNMISHYVFPHDYSMTRRHHPQSFQLHYKPNLHRKNNTFVSSIVFHISSFIIIASVATSTKRGIKKAIQAKHANTDSSHSEDLQDIAVIVPTWAYLSPFSSLLCSQEKVLIEKLGEHFKKQIRKMQIMTFPTMTIRCKNHFL